MESKYVVRTMLAVFLTAMVLGTAAAGAHVNSNFVASAGPRGTAVFGGHQIDRSLLPATSNLIISVTWCSDVSAVYCVPIPRATVLITTQAGAYVGSAQTDIRGQAQLAVNSPATYRVNVDIENVSAFGYMAGSEYMFVQTSAGSSFNALFQYVQPGPLPW